MVLPGGSVPVSLGTAVGLMLLRSWAPPFSLNLPVRVPGHQHTPCYLGGEDRAFCLEERTGFSSSP